jgi:hypothetical protein
MLIDLQLSAEAELQYPEFGIGFDDVRGGRAFAVATYLSSYRVSAEGSTRTVRARVEGLPLAPGTYFLSLSCGDAAERLRDCIDHAVAFEMVGSDFYGNGAPPAAQLGEILMRSTWMDLP